jgi:DNA primase
VIVVEGYFDCMRVHQAGFPGVLALMGASLSPRQESTLLERFERVILLLDGDTTGRHGSRTIAARLSGRCPVVAVHPPDGTQPDQLSSTAIQELLKHRTSDSF